MKPFSLLQCGVTKILFSLTALSLCSACAIFRPVPIMTDDSKGFAYGTIHQKIVYAPKERQDSNFVVAMSFPVPEGAHLLRTEETITAVEVETNRYVYGWTTPGGGFFFVNLNPGMTYKLVGLSTVTTTESGFWKTTSSRSFDFRSLDFRFQSRGGEATPLGDLMILPRKSHITSSTPGTYSSEFDFEMSIDTGYELKTRAGCTVIKDRMLRGTGWDDRIKVQMTQKSELAGMPIKCPLQSSEDYYSILGGFGVTGLGNVSRLDGTKDDGAFALHLSGDFWFPIEAHPYQWKAGVRIEYFFQTPRSHRIELATPITLPGWPLPTYFADYDFEMSMIPVLAGVSLTKNIVGTNSAYYGVSLMGGYAFASTTYRFFDPSTPGGTTIESFDASGGTPLIELLLSFRIRDVTMPGADYVGMDWGYRLAFPTHLTADGASSIMNFKSGEKIKDVRGNALPFNPSGFVWVVIRFGW